MRACAHRGDSSRYRENTLPAIRSAIAAGAELVEIDVRVTADGAVIVLHDDTLERLWELPARVSQVTLAQVRELGEADSRPPLLSEVLALFVGTDSTLLIDMDDAALAEPAWQVVARAGADAATSVAWCGDLDGMRTIRRLDDSANIWMPWSSTSAPTAADVAELTPSVINTPYLTMTREQVGAIHAMGCAVTVWTVDDEQTMRWARSVGVDVVTTNRLTTLQRVLAHDGAGGTGAGDPGDGRVAARGAGAGACGGADGGAGAGAEGGDSGVDLDAAMAVARGLAQWAIGFARSADPGEITTKADAADLVTEVDVAVETHVRAIIAAHFPGHGFVGEEQGGAAEPGVPCWYLDPVDGTANFANRIPWNAFSLALAVDDQPLVAVVADPWRGDLFEAFAGRGARLNGVPLQVPGFGDGAAAGAGSGDGASSGDGVSPDGSADPLVGRIVSTELANHVPWPGMLQLLEKLGERYCTMRVMGSGTMTLVGIAAGRGVGAVIGRFGAVDHVAAALIVHEAGGIVLDSAGDATLFPSAGGIMAATTPAAASALYGLWSAAAAPGDA